MKAGSVSGSSLTDPRRSCLLFRISCSPSAPTLKRGVLDTKEAITDEAREARRNASDVWRGWES